MERFESELRASKEAGAEVVRTATLGGRRYETLDSIESFRQFADRSWQALTRNNRRQTIPQAGNYSSGFVARVTSWRS